MRVGKLRHTIDIQSNDVTGYSDLNEEVRGWVTWREGVYAGVDVRRGKEHFNEETKQRFTETVYHFTVRYSEIEGMSPAMRILFEGQVYEVRTIMPDRQNRNDAIIEATLQGGVV
jgi:head-tail adaptor